MSEKVSDLKSRLQYALDVRNKRAVDLVNDLHIPKSAVSQYLSGKSQKMDSTRLFSVCRYLEVSEPWLLGYDVPMEGYEEKENPTGQDDGMSENVRKLIDFARSVLEDKAAMILQVMKTIVEGD